MSLASPETPAEKLYATVYGEGHDAGWSAGVEAEREACAKLADAAGELATGVQFIGKPFSDEVKVAVEATMRQVAKNIAEAIRRRTED